MRHCLLLPLSLVLCVAAASYAVETVVIDPAKVAQLDRLAPLTNDKVDVFVEAGQLTRAQAELVKKHIGKDGKLNLPAAAIGAEPQRVAAPPPPPTPSREGREEVGGPPASSRRGEAGLTSTLGSSERDHLTRLIQDYRYGNRSAIGRELRKARPAVNELIAAAYKDPVDFPIKIRLWEEVSGPANPEAAVGLFELHKQIYEVARPVLIPYAKDVGGAVVRRKTREAGVGPNQIVYGSRDLRDMILEVEGLIAHCSGVPAATFLMDVYAERYSSGEAPMRDKGRDRHRLVEACGGNPKHFDQDERDTWSSRLTGAERAAIAGKLIPWLHRHGDDRRQIARNGLMICLPARHPHWEAGEADWERWWQDNKDRLGAKE